MKKKVRFLALIVLSAFFLAFSFSAEASLPTVRVRIDGGKTSGTLSSSSAMTVTNGRGQSINAGTRAVVRFNGDGTVTVAGKKQPQPVMVVSRGPISWNDRPYRGKVELRRGSEGWVVVNVINVEDYLRGVLKMEINPAWPMEAIRAQAIVARTYAVAHANQSGAKGYDFDDSHNAQVYRGINAEDPILDKGIAATRGMVLFWQGKPALTPYHSDSGGWTADVRDVWGGARAYLVSKQEPFSSRSPHETWTATLSTAEMTAIARKLGTNVGEVTGLSVIERDRGGRAVLLRIDGTRGSATVKSHSFRMAADPKVIRSTFFDLNGDSLAVPEDYPDVLLPFLPSAPQEMAASRDADDPHLLITLTQEGAFTKEELMDMLLRPETRSSYVDKALSRSRPTTVRPVPSRPSRPSPTGRFVFQGRGWGHGVGMSQWGAKAMADNGWKAEKILSHYYPGTYITYIY